MRDFGIFYAIASALHPRVSPAVLVPPPPTVLLFTLLTPLASSSVSLGTGIGRAAKVVEAGEVVRRKAPGKDGVAGDIALFKMVGVMTASLL